MDGVADAEARIVLCTNDECVLRKRCYRAQAEPRDGQSYRRFEFTEKANKVSCDRIIPIVSVPEVQPTEDVPKPETKEFTNDAVALALAEANRVATTGSEMTVAKKKKSRATYAMQCDRVRIIRDAIRAGKNNRDIYAACKRETGVDVNPNMVASIRSGHYHGWGADLLQIGAKAPTADAPPARAKSATPVSDLKAQLRWIVAAMPSHGLEKLTVHADGRVESEITKRQTWNVTDA